MKQRAAIAIVLVMMVIITVLAISFISSAFPGLRNIAQLAAPLPAPTPTDTPIPTPTPSPTTAPLPPTFTPTPPPFISGSSAYLIDADTGRVLFRMNSNQQKPIASTTKIMTAIVAIENGNLEQGVIVQQSDLDQVPPSASNAGLAAGDYFRLRTLLYGLMLPSGTDASIVIARAVAGSTDNFVAMMNRKARALQLTHTHFSNPHGYGGADHYSSAADLVTLANYALRNPLFAQFAGRISYDVRPSQYTHAYHWVNTNTLLTSYQGADGVKTGWTDSAGVCLVFSARRNGHHFIGAELKASTYDDVFADGAKLLNLGFSKD
jgi:D-alanyl-D-alanine carboxypeptidase (penicillin-binding protein 5/6)